MAAAKSAWIQTVAQLGFCLLGGRSSVRLEHLDVVQDVGGSNPLGHPNDEPAERCGIVSSRLASGGRFGGMRL